MLNRLSTAEEINEIIAKGIKRKIPDENIGISSCDFSPFTNLLKSLQIESNFLAENLDLQTLTARANVILPEFTEKILKTPRNSLYDACFDYLAQSDYPTKADWIFVFGSKNLDRPKKAAELFLAGYGNKIYFSGSRPLEEPNREHEGQTFRTFVKENYPIPEDLLIADPHNNSLTMVDNVRGFLNYLDDTNQQIRSVIIVSSSHTLRRGWCLFKKYTTGEFKIIRESCGYRPQTGRDDWFANSTGIRLIFEEYLKIRNQEITNTS